MPSPCRPDTRISDKVFGAVGDFERFSTTLCRCVGRTTGPKTTESAGWSSASENNFTNRWAISPHDYLSESDHSRTWRSGWRRSETDGPGRESGTSSSREVRRRRRSALLAGLIAPLTTSHHPISSSRGAWMKPSERCSDVRPRNSSGTWARSAPRTESPPADHLAVKLVTR